MDKPIVSANRAIREIRTLSQGFVSRATRSIDVEGGTDINGDSNLSRYFSGRYSHATGANATRGKSGEIARLTHFDRVAGVLLRCNWPVAGR